MADEQTADQVRADHLAKLGPDLGPVFSQLRDDLAWLQVKWSEYRELFGSSPERIDLMNRAAGLFFRILQDVLWEDALMHLCRLTDPATTGRDKKENLSIRLLPGLCNEPALRKEVADLVAQAVDATSFARDWRNRHIGHRDLALALDFATPPLEIGSRAAVSTAIASVHKVLNHINERLLRSTLSDRVIAPRAGAVALLHVLRDGVEAEVARRDRIGSGQFTRDDLRHRAV